MNKVRAAICQSEIIYECKSQNLETARGYIEKAAAIDSDIIFFPEMSFTGFSMDTALTGETDYFTVNTLRRLAREYGIFIAFGYVNLINGKGENHYTVIASDGEIVSDYVKIHSFSIGGEGEGFLSGSSLPKPFEVSGQSISTFICYDLRFPEIFRARADNSSIIAVAANWPRSRRDHWITLLKARAIENQVYIIGINCVGTQGDLEYCGDSLVINPNGEIIASARQNEERLIICDIVDDCEKFRRDFPVMKSRRKDLYRSIMAVGEGGSSRAVNCCVL